MANVSRCPVFVPRRSQRTRSVLTFFTEDAGTHTLLYANADLSLRIHTSPAFCAASAT